MLEETRTLLPVGDLAVTEHEPVLSSSNNAFDLRANVQAIRTMEGKTGHYMGMMPSPVMGAAGVAFIGTRVSFSIPSATTIAHELGHNMSLYHAPCGGAGGPDSSYPYPDGSIGTWGYDFRDGGRLVHPRVGRDLMTYCSPRWISDYSFTNALRYRLFDEGPPAAAIAASSKSLLLWGGVGADSVPYLEPAFVVDAPAGAARLSRRVSCNWANYWRRRTLLPQPSPCPKWPTAMAVRPSHLCFLFSPRGRTHSRASRCRGQVAPSRWTARATSRWPSCAIPATGRCEASCATSRPRPRPPGPRRDVPPGRGWRCCSAGGFPMPHPGVGKDSAASNLRESPHRGFYAP